MASTSFYTGTFAARASRNKVLPRTDDTGMQPPHARRPVTLDAAVTD